jgi:hypothetical protein
MKKMTYISSIIATIALLAVISNSCSLDTKYYGNTKSIDSIANTDHPYSTREDIKGQLDAMYQGIKDGIQESGYADFLIYTDVLADNAYAGSTTTGEIMALESHTQDATNKNTVRDWNFYLAQVSNANQVITYMDDIKDATLTETERKQWVAEAKIWRAYMWFDFCRLYGDIPMITKIPSSITAENLKETYPLYYPARTAVADVYAQMISDLEESIPNAPDLNTGDKFVCSKALGYGLLARIYSEKQKQDWSKVAECCSKVEAMNLSLVPDYADLWSWNDARNDVKLRNSSESIFEVPYTPSAGNWVWMMFWRQGLSSNLNDSFTWAKWVTPSKNLIKAYEDEGDEVRYEQTIVYDQCGWATYNMSGSSYPFMYKTRDNAASIIKMRLAEIYLMHAEADVNLNKLSEAASYVNKVRERAKLADLPSSASASKESMLNAVLKERRLELAFEGFRWFDLIRNDRAVECVNNFGNKTSEYYDSEKAYVKNINENGLLMAVPQTQLENNPNLTQNPGY